MVQRAKNKVGMTQRHPDMWQALTFMARMMSRLAKSNDNFIDWGAIIHQTILSSPPVPASIPAYADFLKLYGTDTYVDELSQFARKYCKTGTHVPGSLFQAIANLKCNPSELIPDLAIAIIMACGSAPVEKLTDRSVCTFK